MTPVASVVSITVNSDCAKKEIDEPLTVISRSNMPPELALKFAPNMVIIRKVIDVSPVTKAPGIVRL